MSCHNIYINKNTPVPFSGSRSFRDRVEDLRENSIKVADIFMNILNPSAVFVPTDNDMQLLKDTLYEKTGRVSVYINETEEIHQVNVDTMRDCGYIPEHTITLNYASIFSVVTPELIVNINLDVIRDNYGGINIGNLDLIRDTFGIPEDLPKIKINRTNETVQKPSCSMM